MIKIIILVIQILFIGAVAPDYTIINAGNCSITSLSATVVYESATPYPDNENCRGQFECPTGQILTYRVNRFETESGYDKLGI